MENKSQHTLIKVAGSVIGIVLVIILLLFMLLFGSVITGCTPAQADTTNPGGGQAAANANYKPLEHSSDPVAENTSTFAEQIALDDSHGYSQARRNGNPDYDCSSLVYFALKHAGVNGLPSSAFSTFTMGQDLLFVGFTHFTWSGRAADAKSVLKRGDIVVNRVAHTEVYVGGGYFAAARHATPSGIEDGHPGDQGKGDNQEIVISSYLDPGLTDVYRHDPSKPATAQPDGTTTTGVSMTSAQCDTNDVVNAADVTNGSVAQAKQAAKQIVAGQFPSDSDREYSCLEQLWEHESGWRVNAENPSSGAYGIPQSLPGKKMASAGPDWKTNATTQIKWGLNYIKNRPDYGTPCAAWDKWQSRSPHWY